MFTVVENAAARSSRHRSPSRAIRRVMSSMCVLTSQILSRSSQKGPSLFAIRQSLGRHKRDIRKENNKYVQRDVTRLTNVLPHRLGRESHYVKFPLRCLHCSSFNSRTYDSRVARDHSKRGRSCRAIRYQWAICSCNEFIPQAPRRVPRTRKINVVRLSRGARKVKTEEEERKKSIGDAGEVHSPGMYFSQAPYFQWRVEEATRSKITFSYTYFAI